MARKTYPFARVAPTYRALWDRAEVDAPAAKLKAAVEAVLAGKQRYMAVEAATGAPWWWVGALHYRESSCDFAGVLHNGEEIIGTGRKTELVPEGRGPFSDWQSAAADALAIKGIRRGAQAWTLEMVLYQGERFNGFGYRERGVPSAYLWSGTTVYVGGKYIRDHVWSATAKDKQLGIVPIIRRLMEIDASVRFADAPAADPAPAPEPPPPAVAIDPSDGLSEGEVRALQQRLRDLGYAGVGRVDGKYGPDTTGAVAAFQSAAGLPVTGQLDATTAAALTTAPAKQIGASRATTTAATMRQRGDAVTKSTWWAKIWAWAVGAPSLAVGVAGQTDTASGYIATAKSLLSDVPDIVWLGALVAVAAAIYLTAQRAEGAAVANVRDGRDAGPA